MTDRSNTRQGNGGSFRGSRALLFLCLLSGLIAVPGCKGCWKDPLSPLAEKKKKELDEEELLKQKKLEKPKDDFEPIVVRMLPSNDPSPDDKVPHINVKAGHWMSRKPPRRITLTFRGS